MNLDDYQKESQKTDRVPGNVTDCSDESVVVPMLGLAGEAGQLLSEYKKYLRDGDSHTLFTARVEEELGDLLWYISNVATKFGLSLSDVATKNLAKTDARWLGNKREHRLFDDNCDIGQQLPRKAIIEIHSLNDEKVRIFLAGQKIGADLTDNAYDPDGYRFHDVFHFAFAAVLGWSPVTRAIVGVKRRDSKTIDEIEDGGRAIVIEEGISALVFEYARKHNFLEGVSRLDFDLLRIIQDMTAHLEVKERTPAEWESAILQGYEAWRKVVDSKGGKLEIDQANRIITFKGPVKTE